MHVKLKLLKGNAISDATTKITKTNSWFASFSQQQGSYMLRKYIPTTYFVFVCSHFNVAV